MGAAWSAPLINDVSTDLEDPPRFTQSQHPDALPAGFAEKIRSAYADLADKPLWVPSKAPAEVLAAAKVAVAAALPNASVVAESDSGVELVDVTPLLRFRDDISVRVRQKGGDSVVDVRSASRLGRGDLGANAARIRTLLAALRQQLGR